MGTEETGRDATASRCDRAPARKPTKWIEKRALPKFNGLVWVTETDVMEVELKAFKQNAIGTPIDRLTRQARREIDKSTFVEPGTRPDDAERYDWECRVGNKEVLSVAFIAATTAEAQALAEEQAEFYLGVLQALTARRRANSEAHASQERDAQHLEAAGRTPRE